jgi:hypothetical protein
VFIVIQKPNSNKVFLSYLITAVIYTNYGKTTRIPNIPETGTLLKHGTNRNKNFGNKKKIILKTQHIEVPIMLPQVAYKGYTLHWVYQVIIETV